MANLAAPIGLTIVITNGNRGEAESSDSALPEQSPEDFFEYRLSHARKESQGGVICHCCCHWTAAKPLNQGPHICVRGGTGPGIPWAGHDSRSGGTRPTEDYPFTGLE